MRAALLLPFLIAACDVVTPKSPMDRLTPQTSEAITQYSFNGCTAEISAAERQRLRGFVNSLPMSRQDTILVSVPRGGTPQRDSQRVQTIRHLFTGAPAQTRIVADENFSTSQCQSTGLIRIVRVSAVEIDCRDGASATGCSSARNLSAMLANPGDLFMPDKTSTYMAPTGTMLEFEDWED